MSQYVFGTGQLFSTPVGGGAPLRLGALQDVSVDFNGEIKSLFGQYSFPLSTARGKTTIEWKAQSGNIDVTSFNTMFFGQTVADNDELLQAINETGTVPAMSTYTVTVDEAATFFMDLGVTLANGTPLVQVASMPGALEYSVSAMGVYTFNSAQASAAVLINYLYESASTGGTLTLSNTLMGSMPQFQLVLSQTFESKTFTLILFAATAEKLSLPLKQDDYLIADLSGQAFANSANQVGRITTTSITGGGA
jgi:hypothetical protein